MKKRLNILSISLLFLFAIAVVSLFNLYTAYTDLKDKNATLTEQLEQLEAAASTEQKVFSKTEGYLKALLKGNAKSYLTDRYIKEVEKTEYGASHQRAQIEEMDIYNISVRKQKDDQYLVYSIYKASLGSVDKEITNPANYTTYILMSKITFVKENGELKVDNHDIEPIEGSQKFFDELKK